MPYVGGWVRAGDVLGETTASPAYAALSAQWSALNDQIWALQQSGQPVPGDLVKQASALHDQMTAGFQNAVQDVLVTPDIFNSTFKLDAQHVGWGDHGDALNAALSQWAQSGTWHTVTNPDGSISGGIDVSSAPDYVQTAWRALFGNQFGTAQPMTQPAPGAIPAPAPVLAPARYIIDGVEVDEHGNPVPGGYNAKEDAARQQAAAAAAATATPAPATTSPDPMPARVTPAAPLVDDVPIRRRALQLVDDNAPAPTTTSSGIPPWVIAAGVGVVLLALSTTSPSRRH